jgi:hypothetical protein
MNFADIVVKDGWLVALAVTNALLVIWLGLVFMAGHGGLRSGLALLLLFAGLFVTIPAAINGDPVCVSRFGRRCVHEDDAARSADRASGIVPPDLGNQSEPDWGSEPATTVPATTTTMLPATGTCFLLAPDREHLGAQVDCSQPHDARVVAIAPSDSCPPEATAFFARPGEQVGLCVTESD